MFNRNFWVHNGVMGFLLFALFGLLVGALAKVILPGKRSGGWISSMLFGMIGSVVGGWLGAFIFHQDFLAKGFFSLSSWVAAVIGTLLVMIVWGKIRKH